MSAIFYLLDVPVYRLPIEAYDSERERDWKDTVPSGLFSPASARARDDMMHIYGGCWMYNEIIGWIRLYIIGDQLRGEYFAVRAKRIVRTRRKTFEFKTSKLAPEVSVPSGASNKQIYDLLRDYVNACQRELRGRYIDTEILDNLAPYIDWKRMLTDRR